MTIGIDMMRLALVLNTARFRDEWGSAKAAMERRMAGRAVIESGGKIEPTEIEQRINRTSALIGEAKRMAAMVGDDPIMGASWAGHIEELELELAGLKSGQPLSPA